MIKKSIGIVRNLLKKRTLMQELVKKIALADDVLVITNTSNHVAVAGHTESDAMNIVLLGTAVAAGYKAAEHEHIGLELNQYIEQVSGVAFKRQGEF